MLWYFARIGRFFSQNVLTFDTAEVQMHRNFLVAVLVFLAFTLFGSKASADPLSFSNVVALQNGGLTTVDLFNSPGATLFGPQVSFRVDISGTLPSGGSDILRITYTEFGSAPVVQQFAIPLFGSVQPPFSLLFSINAQHATFQGVSGSLMLDLLSSSPDFVIPSGPNAGQSVNSYTYNFNVAQPVPEPASIGVLAPVLLSLFAWRTKGHRKKLTRRRVDDSQ